MYKQISSGVAAGLRRMARGLMLLGALAITGSALAQGGPPMVTDDPDTPGDGHWEINLGAIATHSRDRWQVAAPDADVNYGWGDHIQLKLDVPWVFSRDDGQHWKSGVGTGDAGVKWRFIDQEKAGVSVSIYPQYSRSMLNSSTRRGITGAGHEFFLPIEISTDLGGTGIAAEVGRNFVSGGGADQWVAGIVAGHGCGEGRECLVELHTTQASGEHLTLLNLGFHWKLDDSLTLLGAAGHEFGSTTDDRRQALFYLGLQITR